MSTPRKLLLLVALTTLLAAILEAAPSYRRPGGRKQRYPRFDSKGELHGW